MVDYANAVYCVRTALLAIAFNAIYLHLSAAIASLDIIFRHRVVPHAALLLLIASSAAAAPPA